MISLIEQIKLQLAGAAAGESLLFQKLELLPQNRAWRLPHERAIVPNVIANDKRSTSLPGDHTQGFQVWAKGEIAKTGFPARDLEAVQRVHLHVNRQQIIAAMGPMLQH